jgi:hypothetical protein
MTATVTDLIAHALASNTAGSSAPALSVVLILLLLVLLVLKELVRSVGGSRATTWTDTLNIAIVPLLLAFGFFVAIRFVDLLS